MVRSINKCCTSTFIHVNSNRGVNRAAEPPFFLGFERRRHEIKHNFQNFSAAAAARKKVKPLHRHDE